MGIRFERPLSVGFLAAAALVLASSLYLRFRATLSSRIMAEGANEI